MGDVEKLREDEEMEEGEASESDEDVEVNVTLPTEKIFHNNNGIPYGPDPVTKHSFFSGITTDAKEKPCELKEPSSMHSPSSLSVKILYKSLDLSHDDFGGGYWKSDTLHMWSSESVDAAAIMYYLRNFGPSSIDWTSHNECNVHWNDNCRPIKALLGMSCPIQYGEDSLPAASQQPPSPPRPPTRRHNTPQEAQGETSDKHDSESKKKNKKKKMKKSESSGSSESSSSDSDDSSSSSSDSSSSDSDSSDSDSDDSSSDSDSSSSSSSSSDSDSSSSRKIKAKKRKKLAKAASKRAGEMEVDDVSPKMEGPAVKTEVDVSNEVSVKLSDIPAGCALPKGRWRLGLPCPQSRVLLFRFANSDDIDKAHQMKRKLHAPDDDRKGGVWSLYDEEKRQRKKRRRRESDEEEDDEKTGLRMGRDEERRRRRARRTYEAGVKARLSGPKLGLPIMRPPSAALSLYHPPRPDAFPPPLVAAAAAAEGVYRDLDDPGVQPEDSKNPWGSLAQNWGKKETSCLDYQALLKNHRKAATTGQKRKRDHDEDSGYDGARRNRRDGGYPRPGPESHRRVGDHQRYPDSGGEDRQRSDEEEDGSSESDASDDVVAWNSKMRSPRMKMYADVEEKRRKVKPKRHKPVTDGAQWDPRGRDAAEGSPRKAKSIFSRLGGGDVPHPRTSVNKFREREFIAPEDRDWGAERPVKRSRVTSSPAREAVGGMRSEVHAARARDVKSRLGGGRRY